MKRPYQRFRLGSQTSAVKEYVVREKLCSLVRTSIQHDAPSPSPQSRISFHLCCALRDCHRKVHLAPLGRNSMEDKRNSHRWILRFFTVGGKYSTSSQGSLRVNYLMAITCKTYTSQYCLDARSRCWQATEDVG